MANSELTFGQALELIKAGKKVARRHWRSGKTVFLVEGSTFQVNRKPLNRIYPEGTTITYQSHIDIQDGNVVSTWSPGTADLLAEDWSQRE